MRSPGPLSQEIRGRRAMKQEDLMKVAATRERWSTRVGLSRFVLVGVHGFVPQTRARQEVTPAILQGYLAQKKAPTPRGPSYVPRHSPAVGS